MTDYWLPLQIIIAIIIGVFVYQLSRQDRAEIFAPPVIVALTFSVYAVMAPWNALIDGTTYIFSLNAEPVYPVAWWMIVLFLIGFLIAYYQISTPPLTPSQPLPPDALGRLGSLVCLFSTGLYTLSQGIGFFLRLNPLQVRGLEVESSSLLSLGILTTYFAYSINFLIIGVLFLLAAALQKDRWRIAAFGWAAFSIGLFVTAGFRWRVVVLMLSASMSFLLTKRRRFDYRLALLAFGALVTVGAMGVNRQYGGGIDVEAVASSYASGEIFKSILSSEAQSVFNMTALVIDHIQRSDTYVGLLKPIQTVLITLIPRELLESKDTAQYIRDVFVDLFQDPIAGQAGFAVLNVGEYYLIGGWPTVLLLGMLFGFLLRLLWNWYCSNRSDPFSTCLYCISSSFIYVWISRGFLPGIIILASFVFLPFLVFRRKIYTALVF
jgi:hypothetical protein